MPVRVVVCGNVVFDIIAAPVENPLRWGTTTIVDNMAQRLGGNASSTSYTLGRLGTPVAILSLLGRDSAAEYIVGKLASAGVDTSFLQRTAEPTSSALSLVNPQGERALFYYLGASASAFEEPMRFPENASHFHLAAAFRMRYLRSAAPSILAGARDAGMTTSIDTQWDHAGEWLQVLSPSLSHTDILFVNEDEARMLTGYADARRAAHSLRDGGAKVVVIKLGPKGCLVSTADAEFAADAFRVKAIDTTGAGDCFVGGYLAALDRGKSHRYAARFANAVAALSVQEVGAVEGLKTWEETEDWMKKADARAPALPG